MADKSANRLQAVVVDAKDEAAVTFYAKYGFVPFPQAHNRLFPAMETIAGCFRIGKDLRRTAEANAE